MKRSVTTYHDKASQWPWVHPSHIFSLISSFPTLSFPSSPVLLHFFLNLTTLVAFSHAALFYHSHFPPSVFILYFDYPECYLRSVLPSGGDLLASLHCWSSGNNTQRLWLFSSSLHCYIYSKVQNTGFFFFFREVKYWWIPFEEK